MIIQRDRFGIPYLWADDVDLLARLQGRVTATDRAWQIEVERWRCHGTLAAHLGAEHAAWDRFARRAELAGVARACLDRLDADTRRWTSCYASGINDTLPAAAGEAPEFAGHACSAGRWQPWDPIGVFLVRHILFGTLGDKLWRSQLAGTLGPDAGELFALEVATGSGSNAWVVPGGAHGGPLIAGDPHRLIELPGVYQQIGLACPEFDVIGLAFPGVPGVPHFGHAGSVAWAVTNAMADYQDLYREHLRRDGDRVLCRSVAGWEPVPVRAERIEIRGGEEEIVEVMRTPRGPVIDTDRRTGEALALRTPGMVESDLGFAALLPLLRSRTADEVVAALAHWVEPVNSVLVADRTGAMRRTVAGLVPLRDDAARRQPVPAWEPGHAWTGYVHLPTEVLTAGYVAANDRRPGDTADLGIDFAPPDRARRIVELIDRGAAPERVQCDVHADVDWMHGLLAEAAAPDERAERVRRRLLRWDGAMRADSLDAGLFAAWRSAFARRLCRNPALARLTGAASPFDPLFAPWLTVPVRVGRSVARLAGDGPRLGIDTRRLAAQALLDVAGEQERPWGATHVLEPLAVGTDAATMSGRTGTRSPVDGDTDCVLASGSIPGLDDACRRGPVARYVWDLGERGRSRWIVPFGAAGRPGDPHRVDQHARWLAGELIPVGPPRPWTTAPEPEPPRQEAAQ